MPTPLNYNLIATLQTQLYKNIQQETAYDKNKESAMVLASKSDRILDLSNELQETLRDRVGAFLFIKNKSDGAVKAITNDFWLMSMQISYKERVQITESFNSSNFSFFGDNAKVYNFSGITVDASSSDPFDPGKLYYQSSILKLYKEQLRGTKLVENNNIAVLCIANHIIEGYPINLNVNYTGDSAPATQFSFAWIVTKHYNDLDGVLNEKRLEKMYSTDNRNLSNQDLEVLGKIQKVIATLNSSKYIEKDLIKKYNTKLKLENLPEKVYIDQLPLYIKEAVEQNKVLQDIITKLTPELQSSGYNIVISSTTSDPINEFKNSIKDSLDTLQKESHQIYIKNSKQLYGIQP